MESLGLVISSDISPIGLGGFGSVFKFDFIPNMSSKQVVPMAGKEFMINDDISSSQGKQQQDLLYSEFSINKELAQKDSLNLFFPVMDSLYDMTLYFPTLLKKSSKNKKYLVPNQNQALFVLVMEYLDFSLQNLMDQVRTSKIRLFLSTRLKIARNISVALLSIINSFTHCDLKPQNIMLKSISEERANQLEEQNLERIELGFQEFYQVKLIDFGLMVKGNRGDRKCPGTTPSYSPPEYLTKTSQVNFDVFSLLIIILDMELVNENKNLFGFNYGIYNKVLDRKIILDDNIKSQIKQLGLFSISKMFWVSKKFKPIFVNRMIFFNSKVEQILKDYSKNIQMETLYFLDIEVMKAIMFATVSVFFNEYSSNHLVLKQVEDLQTKLSQAKSKLEQQVPDSEEYRMTSEEIKFYEYSTHLAWNELSFKSQLVNYCLNNLNSDDFHREPIEDLSDLLKELIQDFDQDNSKFTQYIREYEAYYSQEEQVLSMTSNKEKENMILIRI